MSHTRATSLATCAFLDELLAKQNERPQSVAFHISFNKILRTCLLPVTDDAVRLPPAAGGVTAAAGLLGGAAAAHTHSHQCNQSMCMDVRPLHPNQRCSMMCRVALSFSHATVTGRRTILAYLRQTHPTPRPFG